MSSISSVSSATSPYQTTNQTGPSQLIQDFNAVGSALQSGDLSSAQSALATLQQNLPTTSQTSATQPFGNNGQANTDYQSLTTALQTGNLSGAQKAYASLQKDLQGAGKTHRHHHHHSSGSSDGTTTATTSQATSGSSAAANALLDVTA
jgi:hypothetical protein